MNYRKNPYKHTHVMTASPGELIVMLYDGAIRFTSAAHQTFEAEDFVAASAAVTRAVNIIGYLQSILDDSHNPDMVALLDATYYKWTLHLTKANATRDPSYLPGILEEIEALREAWVEVNSQETDSAAVG